MKKLHLSLITLLLVFLFLPGQTFASTASNPEPIGSIRTVQVAEVNLLLSRLDAINEIDKSTMSLSEKRQLRKEVRTIKNQLKAMSGGVYLSIGAILIIALLLILLL